MSERVRVDIDERVALVTINDPSRRNALDLDLCKEFVAAIDAAEACADVGALVVTGAPPAFCGGADLSHLETAGREGLLAVYEGFLRVARSPLPTVAAVNGHAVGAGVNLALACDLRIAAVSARFDTRFLRLGIHPGGGHAWMMTRTAGLQTTMAAVLFGEPLSGHDAERCGLAWRCVADDELLPSALSLAARVASNPPELVRRVKESILQSVTTDSHAEAIELELDAQIWSMGLPPFRERLAAARSSG